MLRESHWQMKRDKIGRIEIALTVQYSGQKRPVSNSAFHVRLILGLVVSLAKCRMGWHRANLPQSPGQLKVVCFSSEHLRFPCTNTRLTHAMERGFLWLHITNYSVFIKVILEILGRELSWSDHSSQNPCQKIGIVEFACNLSPQAIRDKWNVPLMPAG